MQNFSEFDDSYDQNNKDDQKNQTDYDKVARFKESTALSAEIFSAQLKSIDSLSKKSKKSRNYRIIITDSGTNDGYFLELSKEITIHDYADILYDYFGLDVEVDYDEEIDESIDSKIKTFESIDDLIDFLNDMNKKDE